MVKEKNKSNVVPSSGNVFADLGLSNADEKQTKVRLAFAINQIIAGQHLSQTSPARSLEVNQPKMSALQNYHLVCFSGARLMNFLSPLGPQVELLIRPTPPYRNTLI